MKFESKVKINLGKMKLGYPYSRIDGFREKECILCGSGFLSYRQYKLVQKDSQKGGKTLKIETVVFDRWKPISCGRCYKILSAFEFPCFMYHGTRRLIQERLAIFLLDKGVLKNGS